jgi:colanic acid/amylovoran biosynthesis protein
MRPPQTAAHHGLVIDIVGAQFENKGAELMLRTAMAKVGERLPDARFALSLNRGSPEQRRRLGLLDTVWRPSRSPTVSAAHNALATLFGALPRTERELMPDMGTRGGASAARAWLSSAFAARSAHSVLPREVDCVLDVSGYLYGDAWGWADSEMVGLYYRKVKKHGGRVFLLPQTLGPFEDPRTRAAFLQAYAQADLVFARDAESLGHAEAVVPDASKLRQAPDITTVRYETGAGAGWAEGKACLIPNARMITHVEPDRAAAYVPFLRRTIALLRRLGMPAFMLIHDRGDEEVARKALRGIDDVELVLEDDSLRIKEIIGRSFITISSRLHGLINALSQGVPSLATAWAHKYPTLLAEYGMGEFLIDPREADESIEKLIRKLAGPGTRPALVARLEAAEADRIGRVEAMWDEVVPLIAGCRSLRRPHSGAGGGSSPALRGGP